MEVNNISFGMKIPTRKVIDLAINKPLYQKQFDSNIEVINQLTSNSANFDEMEFMGCAYIFDLVSEVINKQFPQLRPFIKKINLASKELGEKGRKLPKTTYDKEIEDIMVDAEKKLGKALDVSTADVKKAVAIGESPSSLAAYGLL